MPRIIASPRTCQLHCRDTNSNLCVVNGEGGRSLFEQYMRIDPDSPEWDSLGIPMKAIFEAVADLRAAFVRHHENPGAHPKPAGGPTG